MHFFMSQGKEAEGINAAKQVFASDPTNLEAARMIARYGVKTADLVGALNTYAAILKRNPADIESLNIIGRYAYSANDTAKFSAALQRLSVDPAQRPSFTSRISSSRPAESTPPFRRTTWSKKKCRTIPRWR
jgi:hypothetical protein